MWGMRVKKWRQIDDREAAQVRLGVHYKKRVLAATLGSIRAARGRQGDREPGSQGDPFSLSPCWLAGNQGEEALWDDGGFVGVAVVVAFVMDRVGVGGVIRAGGLIWLAGGQGDALCGLGGFPGCFVVPKGEVRPLLGQVFLGFGQLFVRLGDLLGIAAGGGGGGAVGLTCPAIFCFATRARVAASLDPRPARADNPAASLPPILATISAVSGQDRPTILG